MRPGDREQLEDLKFMNQIRAKGIRTRNQENQERARKAKIEQKFHGAQFELLRCRWK